MTNHDQTALHNQAKTGRIAPAASLTRVSIRPSARPSAPADQAQTARVETIHAAPATPAGKVSAPTVIELRTESSGASRSPDPTPAPRPAPSRVFPSAQARAPQTIPPAAFHDDALHEARVAPSAVIDLWEHLAADRLRPVISDVDPITIASQWPNSLLLRVTEAGRRPGLEVAHMFTPTAGSPTSAIPIDAMTVDWIISLGREVVITGEPVHETDAVPTGNGPISCGVIALPFGPEIGVDHVLCHLYRVDKRVVEAEVSAEISLPPRDRTGIKRLFGR